MRWSSLAVLAVVVLTGCQSNPSREQVSPQNAQAASTAQVVEAKAISADISESERAQQALREKLQQEYRSALVFMEGKRDREAEQALRDIIRRHPNYPGPHANLGILYQRQGKLDEALTSFDQALLLNPDNAVVQNLKGMVLRELGRFQDAAQAYVQATRADASYADAYLNLGILYDLYLHDVYVAQFYYQHYQSLLAVEDSRVKVWLGDLQQRMQ